MFKISVMLILYILSFQIFAQSMDPTKPLTLSVVKSDGVKKGLVLETIVHGKKNKSAIISGKLMKVGDYIGVYKLIKVNRSSVVLRSEDGPLRLSIFSGVVVK